MKFFKGLILVIPAGLIIWLGMYVAVSSIASRHTLAELTQACPNYELPEFLADRTDGQTLAIGILLERATRSTGCVTVTNSWFSRLVTRDQALAMAEGY